MLAPVVLFSIASRVVAQPTEGTTRRPPLLPGFVLAFLFPAAANSLGLVPEALSKASVEASRWAELAGIVAVA